MKVKVKHVGKATKDKLIMELLQAHGQQVGEQISAAISDLKCSVHNISVTDVTVEVLNVENAQVNILFSTCCPEFLEIVNQHIRDNPSVIPDGVNLT